MLIRELKEEMDIAAQAMAFEQAAYFRDSLQAVIRYSERMKMVTETEQDRDLFVVEKNNQINEACGVLLKIREGKLVGKFHRFIKPVKDIPIRNCSKVSLKTIIPLIIILPCRMKCS